VRRRSRSSRRSSEDKAGKGPCRRRRRSAAFRKAFRNTSCLCSKDLVVGLALPSGWGSDQENNFQEVRTQEWGPQDGCCFHPPHPLHHHLCCRGHTTTHLCTQESLPGGCSGVIILNGDMYVVLLDFHLHDPNEPFDRTHPQPACPHRCQKLLGPRLDRRGLTWQNSHHHLTILIPYNRFNSGFYLDCWTF